MAHISVLAASKNKRSHSKHDDLRKYMVKHSPPHFFFFFLLGIFWDLLVNLYEETKLTNGLELLQEPIHKIIVN